MGSCSVHHLSPGNVGGQAEHTMLGLKIQSLRQGQGIGLAKGEGLAGSVTPEGMAIDRGLKEAGGDSARNG